MKKIMLSVATLATVVAVSSNAQAGFYAGLNASVYNDLKVPGKNDSGQQVSVNLGYDFPLFIPLAVEAEYAYNDFDTGTVNSYGLNGYFFIPFPIVSPYIGYGLGSASIKDGNTEAYNQFIGGVRFKIPVLPLAVSAEYRYIKINNAADITQALLGVKYMF